MTGALYTFAVRVPNEPKREFTWDFAGMSLTEAAGAFTARGDEAIRRAWGAQHDQPITDAEVARRRDHVTVRNADEGAEVTV